MFMSIVEIFFGGKGPWLYDDSQDNAMSTVGDISVGSINSGSGGGAILEDQRSSDPADPPAGGYHIWMSDGTASGNDGDIMIKQTNSAGTTHTNTLQSF